MSRDSESNREWGEYWERRKIAWERRKMGLEFRHRYELYFVTLTFTLLGLAVQTAKGSTFAVVKFIEFGGWSLLFLSGLLGFYILENLWRREVGVAEISDLSLQGLPYRDLEADVNRVERRAGQVGVISVTGVCTPARRTLVPTDPVPNRRTQQKSPKA